MSANQPLSAVPADAAPAAALEGVRNGEGHGRRLTAAFEALEGFPALAESRNRLLALVGGHRVPIAEVVETVESDIALVVAVMRVANDLPTRGTAKVENIVDAVRVLSPEAVQQLAERVRTFDFFERSAVWDSMPDRFRLHALATRAAADLLANEIGYPDRDRLIVAALLHDVGKLVLMHAYPGYPDSVHRDARTPEERINRERRELGVDHAVVGGV
ncbi:MAG TPA: HDOD domain-containing protein, partial [Solirubrobacteraceae bacterium]|nr:HDOD domain-containing protein [Solirubrobacteraceae bacterium]